MFVAGMQQLLPHLVEGDARLVKRAGRLCKKRADKCSIQPAGEVSWVEPTQSNVTDHLMSSRKTQRLFGEMFCAHDIAETLSSHDNTGL